MNEYGKTKLLNVLSGQIEELPPIWLMRQAGRYLPEYRALREKAGSFWSMCMTPELAAEVTLQPIRRFGFDAAIIFSDILVVPYALGMEVSFDDGPKLSRVGDADELNRDEKEWTRRLAPIYEALRQARRKLDGGCALLGFAGAPWTLATYIAEGGSSADQRAAKLWGYRNPVEFASLLDLIGNCVALHLIAQLEAGADAVQIFDSWASGVPEPYFAEWIVKPTRRIVDKVRSVRPQARIIGFPRGATMRGYEDYARLTGVDAVSLDTGVPVDWAAGTIASRTAIQGNLDPAVLIAGGEAMTRAVSQILAQTTGVPLIFNLGHGILPETPPENVAELVAQVRGGR